MKRIFDVLPLSELLHESREDGKDLGISHMDSGMLHGTQGGFVVLLLETADFSINNPRKVDLLRCSSLLTIGRVVPEKLYLPHVYFSGELESSFRFFMN